MLNFSAKDSCINQLLHIDGTPRKMYPCKRHETLFTLKGTKADFTTPFTIALLNLQLPCRMLMSSVAVWAQGIFGSDASNNAAHPPTLGQAHLTKQRRLCLRECMADAFAEKTFPPVPRTLANLTLGFPQCRDESSCHLLGAFLF